jgi:hypothetical protein
MSVGTVFFLIAFVLFVFAWIGATIVPSPTNGGLCFLCLGLLLSGVPLAWPRG